MNKTLNTKLEDVAKLTAGEFNLQSGTNDVIKIKNTDKLLNGKVNISDELWEDHKQYQLKKYYRSTKKEDVEKDTELKEIFNLDSMINEFIQAIKNKDLSENSCLRRIESIDSKRFEEIKSDFNYVNLNTNEEQPRIRQQEVNIIFKLAFKEAPFIKKPLTDALNDEFGKAKMQDRNKKYRGDNRQEKYYLIPV